MRTASGNITPHIPICLHHTFQYVYTTHSSMFTPRIPVCLHHAFIYANSCSPTMPEAPSHILFKATDCIHICLTMLEAATWLDLFMFLWSLLRPSSMAVAWFVIPFFLSPFSLAQVVVPLTHTRAVWLPQCGPTSLPHLFLLGMTIITNINYQGIPPRYREALTSAVGHDGDCYTQLK